MDITFKTLKNIQSPHCVTIILNTHRTSPDNEKDSIQLKNLIKEAENRLLEYEEKRSAQPIIDNLQKVSQNINHRENLESLILFVNEDIAEFKRLPITVEDRVVIDHSFATRDLIREVHQEANYYILVLNRDNARLIEAFNERVVEEIGDVFPLTNKIQIASNTESSDAGKQRNLIGEFFNQVDKKVQQIVKEKALQVLICTEESNFFEFMKTADKKDLYIDEYLNRSRQSEKAQAITTDAWQIMQAYKIRKNNDRKAELQKAVNENKFLSDTNEIHNAIGQGRVQTLFVEQGLFQPARIENDQIIYVSQEDREKPDVIDDIYDELIEMNADFGGDVVFLPKGDLNKFNGFGATTRY